MLREPGVFSRGAIGEGEAAEYRRLALATGGSFVSVDTRSLQQGHDSVARSLGAALGVAPSGVLEQRDVRVLLERARSGRAPDGGGDESRRLLARREYERESGGKDRFGWYEKQLYLGKGGGS